METTDMIDLPQTFPRTPDEKTSFYQEITKTVQNLTQKIHKTDREVRNIESKMQRLEIMTSNLKSERSTLKRLVTYERDLIYKIEQKLQKVDSQQYRAEIPFLFRVVLHWFQADEIFLRMNIRKAETKIRQRETKLVDVNNELSKSSITYDAFEDIRCELLKVTDSFRSFRTNLGKVVRDLDDEFKRTQNEESENLIILYWLV